MVCAHCGYEACSPRLMSCIMNWRTPMPSKSDVILPPVPLCSVQYAVH